MKWEDYLAEVVAKAYKLGYKNPMVFKGDIVDCFMEGKSVDECVEEVF